MINPKFLCISAAVGFVLSFLIGVVSGIGFIHILLRAFIFAAVFAAVAAGATYLYQKFLSEANPDSDAGLGASSEKLAPKVGGIVDVTVDDSQLPEDEQGPQFYVGNNRASFGSEDLSEKTTAAASPELKSEKQTVSPARAKVETEPAEKKSSANTDHKNDEPEDEGIENLQEDAEPVSSKDASFVPLDFAANAPKIASSDGSGGHSVASKPDESKQSDTPNEMSEDALDDLPDIEDIGPGTTKPENDDIISDSDFASNGSASSKSVNFPDGKNAKEQDSALMAKAISTLLAKDK